MSDTTITNTYGEAIPTRLPEKTATHLYSGGTWSLPGTDDEACEGAKYHSPNPLFVHDVMLVRREWWPEDYPVAEWVSAPRAWLCGSCRDNLDILLQMIHAANGDLDWHIRREFGNQLRALATQGWEWFYEHPPMSTAKEA